MKGVWAYFSESTTGRLCKKNSALVTGLAWKCACRPEGISIILPASHGASELQRLFPELDALVIILCASAFG